MSLFAPFAVVSIETAAVFAAAVADTAEVMIVANRESRIIGREAHW